MVKLSQYYHTIACFLVYHDRIHTASSPLQMFKDVKNIDNCFSDDGPVFC